MKSVKRILRAVVPRPVIQTLRKTLGVAVFSVRNATRSELPAENIRLHLGCGEIRLPGFINVDFLKTKATDVVADVTRLPNFEDGSVSLVYACQVVEHFAADEVPKILRRWHEVLAPGGTVRISVPDLDKIVKIYMKNWDHFRKDGNSPWIGLIYGGQKDEFDFHKTGFNAYWLGKLLSDAGFVDVQEYPHLPHFCGDGFRDGSLLTEPFGEFFTLNMMATKPR